MDKIKTVKIKNEDGSISEESYTISVDARNVDMDNGKDLQDTIGNIDIDTDGNISEQLEYLNENVNNLNTDIKKKAYFFNTVADMKNANLKVGDYVCTLGYYEVNDGGAGDYQVVSGNYTDDGGSYHKLKNNLYASLIINKELKLKQFGAYGNNTSDDTNSLINAINYCNEKSIKLYINEGTYKITQIISIPNDLIISGSNKQWNIANSNKGSQLNLSSNAYILTDGYCQLSNLLIKGTGLSNQNVGIVLKGGRLYLNNLTVMNFEKGIKNTNDSINLSRFENITITNCKYAIDISNGDSGVSSNSQSLSFINIDIRECWYGYISNAPSNKFFNFCVQAGSTGNSDGYAVKLLNGACNNSFYGTYFENANYIKEIICESGAKYNNFTGNRIISNETHINDLDGNNIFEGYIRQFQKNVDIGEKYFTKPGVVYYDNTKGYGFNLTARENSILMDIDGTSSSKKLTGSNKIVLDSAIQLSGRYITTSLPYCAKISFSNQTISANSIKLFDSAYYDKRPQLVFATVNDQPNISVVSCIVAETGNNIYFRLKNNSDTDFTGDIGLDVMILY